MSLVMSMRFIFDIDWYDACKHVSWTRFGNDVIFPESRGPWFSCNYARVLKSKYPEQGEKILLQCIEALRFSEYCGNYCSSTVKSIHFVVVVQMWSCVALYKSLRYQWFLTFEYYWKQLQLRLTLRLCHGCGHTGSFVLDYHTVYLAAFHVHRIEIPYRAFPERVGPRILSLESVDYFETIDYFSCRKNEQS